MLCSTRTFGSSSGMCLSKRSRVNSETVAISEA